MYLKLYTFTNSAEPEESTVLSTRNNLMSEDEEEEDSGTNIWYNQCSISVDSFVMLIRREPVVKDALWRLSKPSFHPYKSLMVSGSRRLCYNIISKFCAGGICWRDWQQYWRSNLGIFFSCEQRLVSSLHYSRRLPTAQFLGPPSMCYFNDLWDTCRTRDNDFPSQNHTSSIYY